MIQLTTERVEHGPAIERLLDAAFGEARWAKTCQRLRDGRTPIRDLSLVALAGDSLVGTVRLWPIAAGRRSALLLGPLAVDPAWREKGVGGQLMDEALVRARAAREDLVLLVGDPGYYERFGFDAQPTRGLILPGPVERHRFLAKSFRTDGTGRLVGDVRPLAA